MILWWMLLVCLIILFSIWYKIKNKKIWNDSSMRKNQEEIDLEQQDSLRSSSSSMKREYIANRNEEKIELLPKNNNNSSVNLVINNQKENSQLFSKRLASSNDFRIENVGNITRVVEKQDLIGTNRTIRLIDIHHSQIYLSDNIGMIVKLFIEDCSDMILLLKCKLLTSHLEISRCERIKVEIFKLTQTIQIDLSKDVMIICDKDSCNKIFHAGVQDLRVCFEDVKACTTHDYRYPNDPVMTQTPFLNEEQFVTQVVNGNLMTERVKRGYDPLLSVTEREIEKCLLED